MQQLNELSWVQRAPWLCQTLYPSFCAFYTDEVESASVMFPSSFETQEAEMSSALASVEAVLAAMYDMIAVWIHPWYPH